jgi:hypothetical protein
VSDDDIGNLETRGHARASNINNVSEGDSNDDANQVRSGEARVSTDQAPAVETTSEIRTGSRRSGCTAYTDSSCPSGDRVRRARVEIGSSSLSFERGTVIGVSVAHGSGWCTVTWDNGYSNSYRVGSDGEHDLCLVYASRCGQLNQCARKRCECAQFYAWFLSDLIVNGCCAGSALELASNFLLSEVRVCRA